MSAAQTLILSIEDEQTGRFGVSREQIFDGRDGSIGRSRECDWVLDAEGVSRLHALVRYLNGIYFIEDRSTNGMSLNGQPLRRGDPAALKQGDQLQIDTFAVSVRLSGNDATGADTLSDQSNSARTAPGAAATPAPVPSAAFGSSSAQNQDPLDLSLLLAPRRATPVDHAGESEGLIPGAADGTAAGASLDPLAMFDTPSSYADEPLPGAPVGPPWNHTPAAADRFRPPQAQAAPLDGPVLPDDWDATASLAAVPFAPVPLKASAEASMMAGERSASASAAAPASVPSSRRPLLPAELAVPPAAVSTLASIPQRSPDPFASPGTTPSVIAVAAERAGVPEVPAMPPLPRADAASPGTKVAPVTPDPGASTSELKEMFHIAVDTMMDVLRARAELKNSFRLPATLIQRSENNPLKFAPTAQEAVRRLLAPPDGGFLSGRAALDDAADDIRNHQMAMLAGVRSAFQSMLAHFDPARIEQEAEGSARRLSLGGRSRHWERYKEQFETVTKNPDECFRRLFGDEFAQAYEEQLGRLKKCRN